VGAPLALAHDYLTQRGGAERVVAAWCAGWPNAPLFTSLYEPDETFPSFRTANVEPSWLNHVGPIRRHHRFALPLLAPTMSAHRLDADVVLASSSGWAHGVGTTGRLVVYCHAPARWLYQHERYQRDGTLGPGASFAARALGPSLRRWDRRAARRADQYLVNSRYTRDLVGEIYGIDATVIAPPVTSLALDDEPEDLCDVLTVSRLLPYKNVDAVLEVARRMPELRFRVVGDGPQAESLQRAAPTNVTFVGEVGDDRLAREYAGCRVHLALSHEDFGITPLEAASLGRPTVARAFGGYLDTLDETTGVLVDESTLSAASVRDALESALAREWDEGRIRARAGQFDVATHLGRIGEVIGVEPARS
jgi:glycosyltransferase involved in cell wall biosynthesis